MLFLLILAAPMAVVQDMTPEVIREAITWGQSQKRVEPYELKRSGITGGRGVYTTPFLRVAIAANAAKRELRTFTTDSVTPDMIAPHVEVLAQSFSMGRNVYGIARVVVTGPNGANPIEPIASSPVAEAYGNMYGATVPAQSLIATFPATVLRPESEVHIFLTDGTHIRNRFDVGKVR